MGLQFTDPEVASRYECLTDHDHTVTKAGIYRGKLSAITWKMARCMVRQKSNLIKELKPETATEQTGTNEPDQN